MGSPITELQVRVQLVAQVFTQGNPQFPLVFFSLNLEVNNMIFYFRDH